MHVVGIILDSLCINNSFIIKVVWKMHEYQVLSLL